MQKEILISAWGHPLRFYGRGLCKGWPILKIVGKSIKKPLHFLQGLLKPVCRFYLAAFAGALGARPPDLMHSSMVAKGLKFLVEA
jgi:hypothetical protein